MRKIECVTLYGERKTVSASDLILRASAYGIVIEDEKVLLTQMKSTSKYYLPGGGSRLGEKLEDALKREVMEETGLIVQIHRLIHFWEDFFYYDPFNEAYHSLLFYYLCTPLSFNLLRNDEIYDQEAQNPQWKHISELQSENFQNHGDMILQLIGSNLGYRSQTA